jgi:uncharacterized membrane protein YdbT with pleckstrin-like domain
MVMSLLLAALAPLLFFVFITSGFLPFDANLIQIIQKFFTEWKVFGYSLWLLVLWVIFFIEWTDYYLDFWIITNRRIIDVEQNGFFHREITSFRFEQIQDITVETRGLIETFFKFGTLQIQTAGHSRDIIIRDAHYPEDARSLILRLSEKSKSIKDL